MRRRQSRRAADALYRAIGRTLAREAANSKPRCGCALNRPEADPKLWPCPCGDHCAECAAKVLR